MRMFNDKGERTRHLIIAGALILASGAIGGTAGAIQGDAEKEPVPTVSPSVTPTPTPTPTPAPTVEPEPAPEPEPIPTVEPEVLGDSCSSADIAPVVAQSYGVETVEGLVLQCDDLNGVASAGTAGNYLILGRNEGVWVVLGESAECETAQGSDLATACQILGLEPTPEPVPEPTPKPTPVPEPSVPPEPEPTPEPVPEPTMPEPTPKPTPTPKPSESPAPEPSQEPEVTLGVVKDTN